uniref:Uncharacterized protein LOC111114803 isoform X1 n=1 Tax=Crassostrea virginica TaxID=6565 RepID=A0A8B8C1S0_CRAVI|nr:uncharacterized protein LOC111114803 isoform X1 [Crassostrea virginica]
MKRKNIPIADMSDDPGPSSVPKLSLTKPAENYCRLCQLIMTVCSDLFRDILSHHIQPANLRRELDNNKNTLLKALKIHDHKELLFPQSGGQSLSAKDMDLTILYALLRNICGIPPHPNGWGNTPNTGDVTLAACIERIREQKNAIASHSKIGEIDDIRFQDIWMKLQSDIVNIEKELIGGNMYERAVKVLLSCEFTPTKAQESAGVFSRLYDGINEVQTQAKQHNAQKKARMNSIARKQYATKRKMIMATALKKGRMDRLQKQHSAATADIKARIGRLMKQHSSATKEIKDQMNDADVHILHMMQGRFSENEKNIEAWIDRLEKQQSSDIQGLQSTLKEMIEGGFSAMKNEYKESLSAVEEKIEGRISSMEENIEGRMSSMEENMEGRLSSMEEKIEDIEGKMSTMEAKVEDMKTRSFPLVLKSTIEVPGMDDICHISVVSRKKLWVSKSDTLIQVDDRGHVIRTLDDEYEYSNTNGGHTVSVEGDLVFIALVRNSEQSTASDGLESQYIYNIHKMTADGSIATLFTFDLPKLSIRCIHSSHINGDLLIGLTDYSYPPTGRVMRCDGTGRKIGDIELDEEEQRLYEIPKYITENKMNGDIVVSDKGKCALVVVDRSGRHRFDYEGHSRDESFDPCGVCTDILGRILLIHTYTEDSECISLLDHDGQFLTRLLTEPADRDKFTLRSLCVDDKNNIYVAYDDKIKVFK